MKYYNINEPLEILSFEEAVKKGLGDKKGLFMPVEIPTLNERFFLEIEQLSDIEIAEKVLYPFVKDSLDQSELKMILEEVLTFCFPIKSIHDNYYSLELFHGPTMAFKDVGARFMARCLSCFKKDEKMNVLVATSGDTGSAVAQGFHKVEGVEVSILYPKGRVSNFQEYQMTSLGDNIHAYEVAGSFDDCQKLVKEAFSDNRLKAQLCLSSANSINIARLLPQMLYYFFAYRDVRKWTNKPIVFSVPSGNFGNLTAGLMAKRMGLPIDRFIAANNNNDTFYKYWKEGDFIKKPSVETYSNAMDVGNPSNFTRIKSLYGNDIEMLRRDIYASTCTNDLTLKRIKSVNESSNYLLDPHGAVAYYGLQQFLQPNQIGVLLETAHPSKFGEVIRKAKVSFDLEEVDLTCCRKENLPKDYPTFKEALLQNQ